NLSAAGEYDFQGVEVRVIEMPEPGLGNCARGQGNAAALAGLQGYGGDIVFLEDTAASLNLLHAIAELSLPAFRRGVVYSSGNLNAGIVCGIRRPGPEMRRSVHSQSLDQHRRRNEQSYRTINASVMRPITGAPSRQHSLIERAVHLYDNDILNARSEQRR